MQSLYGSSLWAHAQQQAEKVLDALLLDWGGHGFIIIMKLAFSYILNNK